MKRLLFCIFLLAHCQLGLAASASKSQAVSRDDIEFYRTIIPNLTPTATHEEIKRALKKLLRTYHPDKDRSKEAKEKYDIIVVALQKIRGVKASESLSGTNRARRGEIAAFEDECAKCAYDIHQNLRIYFSSTLEHLQSDVAGGVLSLQAAQKRLVMIKQEVAQITNFIAACESLRKNPHCSESSRSRLDDIATNVHGPVSVEIQKEFAEIQRNIAAFRGGADREIDIFINSCRKILQSPWCSTREESVLSHLIVRVVAQGRVGYGDKSMYKKAKSSLIACCVKVCRGLISDPGCSLENANFLETLIAKVQRDEEISLDEQQRYEEIELFIEVRVGHLLWLCKEYIAIPTNLPSRSIFLNQWLKNVQEKKWVSPEEEKALEDVGKEVVDMFISSCKWVLADPLCHATGYEAALREALKNMQGATVISPQYRELYKQVSAKLAELRQQQEKRSDDFHECRSNGNPHVWAAAAARSSGTHSKLHEYWESFKSKAPDKFYRSWVIFKESSKWFLSFTAPVALAMGHGLLNNFLAHKMGHLKQEPFFAAPLYELPIGLSALALHALLGKNLYQKLYDKLYKNPYRDHSEGAATFAVVYLLISGSLQNVGERLPMRGTGWRLPIFGSHQTLFDAILSNISLYAAMHGVILGGVMALGKIPDWLEG